jgi:phosphoribosyl 1,2-cyclic phosphodiesterase
LDAVVVTHEHSDHVAGLAVLSRRCDVPIYCNRETLEAVLALAPDMDRARFRVFATGREFEVSGMRIFPYSLPHDAMDPVGFRVENGGVSLAIATDLGKPTHLVSEHLRGCDAIVLEFNHDPEMLRQSRRPWNLKQRVMGAHGHLSNRDAGILLGGAASGRLRHVVLAHLSEECNRPEIALETARKALNGQATEIVVATQHAPSPPVNVSGAPI